ncbi:MAG: hypothetical protein IPG60_05715 [Bacteroidetes bacterium]|nr:hypothetical protein [Bacteroidota bacterium]MBP7398448.1 hypothetical protein [Chitinophagales bacterium]MBK7109196.1 hypothetical protein [Bacteroidota bacterium]MBK8488483.1 hypothetical protein [Bacteroidota bacterium]MBK8681754.1 hypothetical protein [Bacteroidota bacterium]
MKLFEAAGNSLNQVSALLVNLSNQEYSRPLSILHNASIGKHVRHIINFYQCVINPQDNNVVCYDARERDLQLEENTVYARIIIDALVSDLKNLNTETHIKVSQNFSTNGINEAQIIESTIGREVMYAFDHAVHHMAIIKIGLIENFPDKTIDVNLGIAPSTVRNNN